MKIIGLTQGKYALVDDRDFHLVSGKVWSADKSGRTFYARNSGSSENRTAVKMHRLIMGKIPAGYVVDHINENGLDNRRSNLRVVTFAFNVKPRTKPSASKTRFFGVSFSPKRNRKFRSVVCRADGSPTTIGSFYCAEDAAIARDLWIMEHKPGDRLNFMEKDF